MYPSHLARTHLIRVFLALSITALSAPAQAADVFVGTPADNPDPGETLAIELLVDVPDNVLGGYLFDFLYDANVLHVVTVAGGTTPEFSGAPATNASTFQSGVTPIAAVQGSRVSPSGFLSVATIQLQAIGLPADASDLDLSVASLVNELAEQLESEVFPSFFLIAIPEVGQQLRFDTRDTFSWPSIPNITTYDVYRGTLPDSGGLVFDHTCLIPNVVGTSSADGETPPSGTGFYYLLAAERNGIEGPLGFTSNNEIRPNLFDCSGRRPDVAVQQPRGEVGSGEARRDPGSTRLPALRTTGDVTGDGRLDRQDVTAILDHLVGNRTLSLSAGWVADVDGDGRVDLADAQRIDQVLRSRSWGVE